VLLKEGAVIPRRLVIDGIEFVIENGCGGDMIGAGVLVPIEPRNSPLKETLRLTGRGVSAIVNHIGRERLINLGIMEP